MSSSIFFTFSRLEAGFLFLKRRYRRLRVAFFLVAFFLPPFFAALRPPFFAAFLRPPFFLAAIVSLHDGVELSTRPPVEPPTWLASELARVVTVHAIIVRELPGDADVGDAVAGSDLGVRQLPGA